MSRRSIADDSSIAIGPRFLNASARRVYSLSKRMRVRFRVILQACRTPSPPFLDAPSQGFLPCLQRHLCEFVDEQYSLLPYDLRQARTDDALPYHADLASLGDDTDLSAGFDLGREHDISVWALVKRRTTPAFRAASSTCGRRRSMNRSRGWSQLFLESQPAAGWFGRLSLGSQHSCGLVRISDKALARRTGR